MIFRETDMPQSKSAATGSLILIALIVGGAAAAFAYTAGWLSSARLTPNKMVDAFTPPGGPPLGHRRNHAKGICFTGEFESNGAGTELSRAQIFARGEYPALGRLNLGTQNPEAADASVRVRGMGLQISAHNGEEWRSAMINAPVFTVSTPQAFYQLLLASKNKDPNAMPTFAAEHPEFAGFAAWAKNGPWTSSYAEERFNSLNSFIFEDSKGDSHAVRWSFVPAAQPVPVSPEERATLGTDFLEKEITERVQSGPVRWTLFVTAANPGDPTADPTRPWPKDRRTIEVGTLIARQIEAERNGSCRDINFDPTVLPAGIKTSDDPFPAARSSAYAKSYDLRAAEAAHYPRTVTGGAP
jgi:catalase